MAGDVGGADEEVLSEVEFLRGGLAARITRGLDGISLRFDLEVADDGEGGLKSGAGGEFPIEASEVGSGLVFESKAAYRQTMVKCGPQILEPMMKLDVFAPEEKVGDVIGDLNRRRSMIQGHEPNPGGVRVKAEAPLSAMFGTIGGFCTMTSGRRQFSMEFTHYAHTVSHLAKRSLTSF